MDSVQIQLFGTLQSFLPPTADAHPVAPGTTVSELIRELRIPAAKVHLTYVNGVRVESGTLVRDGDVVGLFPSLGGG